MSNGSQAGADGAHLVQFYENEAFLMDGLSDYIGAALVAGDKGIVIATKPHLATLEARLRQRGLLAREGRYLPLEADRMLPQFMVDGWPDEARFTAVIGDVIRQAALGHDGRIYVFGEMVAILCGEEHDALRSDGKHAAAIGVEHCFNRLLEKLQFSLLCGYPMGAFPRHADAAPFHAICQLHTSVIPTEQYHAGAGIDALRRTIAGLQQKAHALVAEVHERRLIEQALHHVNFDKLTGLPNRSVFQDRLQMEIRKAHRAGKSMALLFIDLDHFKEINDTLGHATGDILLQQVAARLSGTVRDIDTVARLGGDEFTVILSELDDSAAVGRIAQHILERLMEPFELGADVAYISTSIGITLCPDDASTVTELLKNADQAMYAAKDLGRNRAAYFTRSMQEQAQRRMLLTRELRAALPGGQLRLRYQPIVALDSGAVCKAEALLRWQHPLKGLVSPSEFIPVAEHTGLIGPIGEWVFQQAARQAQRWRARDAGFQISVNVSPAQFHQRGIAQRAWLERLGARAGAAPAAVTLEITEGLLLDASSAVLEQLLALRDAGIQVALDDFGTGYSSLAYLRKFDIDYLKIDQSFVRDLDEQPDHLALCEAIIVMAHKLGLKVIAEGVETASQCRLLRHARCDYGQGYWFGWPLPARAFERLLRRGRLDLA